MYAYYGAAALGIKSVQKRWITVLQLVQFFIGVIFGISLLYNDCIFIPWPLIYLGLAYGATIILLFINFYRKEYTEKPRKVRTA
nr:elongation of very long chain fatty acids [Hymenolepis microstoma]